MCDYAPIKDAIGASEAKPGTGGRQDGMSKETRTIANESGNISRTHTEGGAAKKESRSRAWLVDAQCRAALRRDWRSERAYESRILALDEAAVAVADA